MSFNQSKRMSLLNKYLKQLFEGPCKGVGSVSDLSVSSLIKSVSNLQTCLALQNEFVCSLFLDGPKKAQDDFTTGNFLIRNKFTIFKVYLLRAVTYCCVFCADLS